MKMIQEGMRKRKIFHGSVGFLNLSNSIAEVFDKASPRYKKNNLQRSSMGGNSYSHGIRWYLSLIPCFCIPFPVM